MTDMFVRNDVVIPKMVVHGEPIGGIKSGIGSKYVSKKIVDFVQDGGGKCEEIEHFRS